MLSTIFFMSKINFEMRYMVNTEIFRNDQLPEIAVRVEEVAEPTEAKLEARFGEDRIGELCRDFIEGGIGFNARETLDGRQFLVAYIPADSTFSDIPRAVETNVFSKTFRMPRAQVLKDYGKYDPSTTFIAVIDANQQKPAAAGALRIIEFDPNLGFKDVNDLVVDDVSNPWIDEIKSNYFDQNEDYDPMTAWQRLGEAEGVDLRLDESFDIATHASADGYRGKHGSMDSASMLFYHACLRFAQAKRIKNLLAIFDLPPFKNLQQFGEPFDTYKGLSPHPYGGPYDTIPAYCRIAESLKRVYSFNEDIGNLFNKAKGLNTLALLPNEYQPDLYSDRAVGIN